MISIITLMTACILLVDCGPESAVKPFEFSRSPMWRVPGLCTNPVHIGVCSTSKLPLKETMSALHQAPVAALAMLPTPASLVSDSTLTAAAAHSSDFEEDSPSFGLVDEDGEVKESVGEKFVDSADITVHVEATDAAASFPKIRFERKFYTKRFAASIHGFSLSLHINCGVLLFVEPRVVLSCLCSAPFTVTIVRLATPYRRVPEFCTH